MCNSIFYIKAAKAANQLYGCLTLDMGVRDVEIGLNPSQRPRTTHTGITCLCGDHRDQQTTIKHISPLKKISRLAIST